MKHFSIKQMCEAVSLTATPDPLIVCPACGQIFNCRDHTLLTHHNTEAHAALEPSKR